MRNLKAAALFPGQGAFYWAALKESRAHFPVIEDVVSEVDAVASKRINRSIYEVLFRPGPISASALLTPSSEVVQLGIYALSVAVYRVLQSNGFHPDVLVGHSFGEIAALVCGGAYSVAQGTAIVLHRTAALKALSGSGYMAVLNVGASRAEELLAMAGGADIAVASENHRGQTVISGSTAAMDHCAAIAAALKISFTRLKSAYPFHSPVMETARREFRRRIRSITAKSPATPVFSPILNRYYTAGDVLADCLADHLILPVRFASTVRKMYDAGVRTFVECGALNALTKITGTALQEFDVTTLACLDPAGDLASLRTALHALACRAPLSWQIADDHNLLRANRAGVSEAQ